MTRALPCLYKLPGEKTGNVTKAISEHKRWRRRSARFPVQYIQNQAGLAPQHSELHHLQNNGNNQRYLMVFEVCPCLLPRKQQEDFAGPQRAVTSKAACGIQSNQRHSTAWADFLHKSWYTIEEIRENKIGVPLPPPHLHTPHLQPTPKVREAHLTLQKGPVNIQAVFVS